MTARNPHEQSARTRKVREAIDREESILAEKNHSLACDSCAERRWYLRKLRAQLLAATATKGGE